MNGEIAILFAMLAAASMRRRPRGPLVIVDDEPARPAVMHASERLSPSDRQRIAEAEARRQRRDAKRADNDRKARAGQRR